MTLIGIYPNPAQNEINISTKEMGNLTSIVLYSMQGQLIREFKNNEQSINVSDLPRGPYILKIQSTSNVGTKEIILN